MAPEKNINEQNRKWIIVLMKIYLKEKNIFR